MMSGMLYRHKFLESFSNIYGVNVISAMLLPMYVQYSPVADHLICVVPGIYGISERS